MYCLQLIVFNLTWYEKITIKQYILQHLFIIICLSFTVYQKLLRDFVIL